MLAALPTYSLQLAVPALEHSLANTPPAQSPQNVKSKMTWCCRKCVASQLSPKSKRAYGRPHAPGLGVERMSEGTSLRSQFQTLMPVCGSQTAATTPPLAALNPLPILLGSLLVIPQPALFH